MVQKSESEAVIGRRGLAGMKLLFVKDLNTCEASNKIVIFKELQDRGLVGPDPLLEITTRTGLSCEREGVYDILGDRYSVFSIEIPNEYNMIGIHPIQRRLYLQVMNHLSNGVVSKQSGFELINVLSGRNTVSVLEITTTPDFILNEHAGDNCPSPTSVSESFCRSYIDQHNAKNTNRIRNILHYSEYNFVLSLLDIKRVTEPLLPKFNDVTRTAQLRNGRTLQRGDIGSGVVMSNPIGMSPYTSDMMIGSMLTNLPIEVKTFKTPIQDQRLAMSDVDLATWIGDRDIVSIDSVVSDNKLIRTVVVKKK